MGNNPLGVVLGVAAAAIAIKAVQSTTKQHPKSIFGTTPHRITHR
jgi:hypothetical protein